MPESVTDRPTKAHEYVFLLAKQPRYFYDAEAIKETAAYPDDGVRVATHKNAAMGLHPTTAYGETTNNGTRNARSVWNIATQPYSGAHFATMPPELARRCILAGSRPGDIVLDPFAGSGTTAMVALQNGRRAIGTELNPAYLRLQDDRTEVTIGLGL
jgi:DNA modification methylase